MTTAKLKHQCSWEYNLYLIENSNNIQYFVSRNSNVNEEGTKNGIKITQEICQKKCQLNWELD